MVFVNPDQTGTWNLHKVALTSMQRHDVGFTLQIVPWGSISGWILSRSKDYNCGNSGYNSGSNL